MDKTLAKAAGEFALHDATTRDAEKAYLEARQAYENLENARRGMATDMLKMLQDGESEVYIAVDAGTVIKIHRTAGVSAHRLVTL